MKEITIYTDGACSGNPGPGGWGAILIYKDFLKELSGAEGNTTNNRMELQAAIGALKALKEPCSIKLHTDSAYLCNAFNNGWIYNWQRNGWKTSNKSEVDNKDLWLEIISLIKQHEVSWIKVKGHSDDVHNNRCDALARQAINTMRNENKA